MPTQQLSSPLDKISNLQPLAPERVEAFLEAMQTRVIPKILEAEKRQAIAAAEMRYKPICLKH